VLEIYQHVGVAHYLQLEGSTLEPLKMETVGSFEMKNPKYGGSRFLRTRLHSVAAQMRLQITIIFSSFFYGM